MSTLKRLTRVCLLLQRGLSWAVVEPSPSSWSSWCCWWTLPTPGTSPGWTGWRRGTLRLGTQVSDSKHEAVVHRKYIVLTRMLSVNRLLTFSYTFFIQRCSVWQSSTTSCRSSPSCSSLSSTPRLEDATSTSSSSASTCCSVWWPPSSQCCPKSRYRMYFCAPPAVF